MTYQDMNRNHIYQIPVIGWGRVEGFNLQKVWGEFNERARSVHKTLVHQNPPLIGWGQGQFTKNLLC